MSYTKKPRPKIERDKTRKGVGGWNSDGTENYSRHNWFYSYAPQYLDGKRMRDVHKYQYDRSYLKRNYQAITIAFNMTKEEDRQLYEVAKFHIENVNKFVKDCLRMYADYYHIFEEFDDDEDDDYY